MRICDYCKNPIPGVNSGGLTLLVNDAEVGTLLQQRMDLCRECQKLFMGKLHWALRDNTSLPPKKQAAPPSRQCETLPSRPYETIPDNKKPGERVCMMI